MVEERVIVRSGEEDPRIAKLKETYLFCKFQMPDWFFRMKTPSLMSLLATVRYYNDMYFTLPEEEIMTLSEENYINYRRCEIYHMIAELIEKRILEGGNLISESCHAS